MPSLLSLAVPAIPILLVISLMRARTRDKQSVRGATSLRTWMRRIAITAGVLSMIVFVLAVPIPLWRGFGAARSLENLCASVDAVVVHEFDIEFRFRRGVNGIHELEPTMLFRVQGETGMVELARLLRARALQSPIPFSCHCDGDYTLFCFRGTQEVARVGFAHDRILKGVPGFAGDLVLTRGSASKLAAWIAARSRTTDGGRLDQPEAQAIQETANEDLP